MLVFSDPLCPFCQRLEEGLSRDPDLRPLVRYVPVIGHHGSLDRWLARLAGAGWREEEARRWVEQGATQAALSGVRVVPATVIWDGKVRAASLERGRDFRRFPRKPPPGPACRRLKRASQALADGARLRGKPIPVPQTALI
ncbi:DsbA family protein [Thermus tenuipuniceus]|uniref:DsbA family protein n=1 Tax=Thermus tenuipuniceus TaxID=2078690 RepID=UPI0013E29B38